MTMMELISPLPKQAREKAEQAKERLHLGALSGGIPKFYSSRSRAVSKDELPFTMC
jgi:hypothetical protein